MPEQIFQLKKRRRRKINVTNLKKVSDQAVNEIKKLSPDLIVSSYYRKILPKEIYSCAKIAINIHPSFLPYYRGPVPTAWAILNGEKNFGVRFKITEGIDSGDIYVQKSFKIKALETGYELHNRASEERK